MVVSASSKARSHDQQSDVGFSFPQAVSEKDPSQKASSWASLCFFL